jgi:hypothetical protein
MRQPVKDIGGRVLHHPRSFPPFLSPPFLSPLIPYPLSSLLLIPPFNSHPSLPLSLPPLENGVRGITLGNVFKRTDVRMWVLVSFGHKFRHSLALCHIVISSKWVHLLQCKTFLCIFKSNINVLPVPKYVTSNFTSVMETLGYLFVTPVFPRLSWL